MAQVILAHCEPVTVWTSPAGKDVEITLDLTTSQPGDGEVEITGAPGEVPNPPLVPTGTGNSYQLPNVTQVTLHYIKSPTGPPEITAPYALAVI